jgi:hypothetical protein
MSCAQPGTRRRGQEYAFPLLSMIRLNQIEPAIFSYLSCYVAFKVRWPSKFPFSSISILITTDLLLYAWGQCVYLFKSRFSYLKRYSKRNTHTDCSRPSIIVLGFTYISLKKWVHLYIEFETILHVHDEPQMITEEINYAKLATNSNFRRYQKLSRSELWRLNLITNPSSTRL